MIFTKVYSWLIILKSFALKRVNNSKVASEKSPSITGFISPL